MWWWGCCQGTGSALIGDIPTTGRGNCSLAMVRHLVITRGLPLIPTAISPQPLTSAFCMPGPGLPDQPTQVLCIHATTTPNNSDNHPVRDYGIHSIRFTNTCTTVSIKFVSLFESDNARKVYPHLIDSPIVHLQLTLAASIKHTAV